MERGKLSRMVGTVRLRELTNGIGETLVLADPGTWRKHYPCLLAAITEAEHLELLERGIASLLRQKASGYPEGPVLDFSDVEVADLESHGFMPAGDIAG